MIVRRERAGVMSAMLFASILSCSVACLPLCLSAVEPVGWVTRCGQGGREAGIDDLPLLDMNPLPTVITNGTASRYTRPAEGTRTALEFQRTLPQTESQRIRELARGLDYDWRKCYFFVRDNIAFTPASGFMRGAERTLIDREGSDADQALLLRSQRLRLRRILRRLVLKVGIGGINHPQAIFPVLLSHGGIIFAKIQIFSCTFASYDREEIHLVEPDLRGCRLCRFRRHVPADHRTVRILLGLWRIHRFIV